MAETPTAGTPPTGTPPAGTPQAGTPPTGTPPAGTPSAGTAGTPPVGTPPAGTPPAGTPPATDKSAFELYDASEIALAAWQKEPTNETLKKTYEDSLKAAKDQRAKEAQSAADKKKADEICQAITSGENMTEYKGYKRKH